MTDLEDDLKRDLATAHLNEAKLEKEVQILEARILASEQAFDAANKLVGMMKGIMEVHGMKV